MSSRPTLGVVGCLALCNEIAYVLERDRHLDGVFILDNAEGRVLMKKVTATPLGEKTSLVDENEIDPSLFTGRSAVVRVMPAGLHDEPKTILDHIGVEVKKLETVCDSILLFYGLCRNTPKTIQRFIEQWSVPVTFLTEEDGDIPDDCFGSMLGGRRRYLEMMCNNRGTMFITPGYAEHWAARMRDKTLDKMVLHVENYRSLFKSLGYSKIMMLENGLGDIDDFHSKVKVFAAIFNFKIESVRCDLTLFERSYDLAKSKLPHTLQVSERSTGEREFSRTLP